MTESRHRRLESLFLECVLLPEGERPAWLERHCEDAALRREVEDLLARDASPTHLPASPVQVTPLPPPEAIGPYRILEKLGEGGFGEVFEAEQTAPVRRRVALKILKPGMDSRAVLARFDIERQALALMDHSGIARVFDAGATTEGRPYFVMERVVGLPISEFCDREGLDLRARVELMVAVCRAVEHAHQKGVIHRDLKPSNVLVSGAEGKPAPKVIDFGIAKAAGVAGMETLHTVRGEFLGTPEYASPEQAASGGADVDTRSDVYALGAMLYRLLTGQPVFESARLRSGGLSEMTRILREEDPPRPSARAARRELAGDLDGIILKALEKDRARRYASAAALADDLERYLRDEPVVARPPDIAYRFSKLVRRRRALVLGSAAVLLVLLAGAVVSTWQAVRARRAEEEARRQAATANAVSGFLTRIFGEGNPERNPQGADVKVREILDQAARELDAGTIADPAVESGVRHALGSTYMGLGLYEEAGKQLERASTLAEGASLPSGSQIQSRLAIAELAVRSGAYPKAESLLVALEPNVDALAASHPDVRVRWLRIRGDNFTNLGGGVEADSLLTLAVAASRTGATTDSLTLSGALSDLARLRGQLGAFAAAESLSRESYGITRRAHAGDHHEVAAALAGLAEILRAQGRFSEAESLLAQQVAIERRILGPRHPGLAYALTNHATVLDELGRLEEAEREHREGLELLHAAFGDRHPEAVTVMGNLANTLQDEGKLDEALALRRQVLDIAPQVFGAGHPSLASAWNNLGALYRLMKRYGEAEVAFREAIARFRAAFGPDHPLVAVATHNLGKTLLDGGRAAEAEPLLRDALALGAKVFPPDHVNLSLFSATHGRALVMLGRYPEAERELLAAHEKIAATFGRDHARTLECEGVLASLYTRWGRPADAARYRSAPAR